MYFGSEYVYKYEHSSDESISDDDEEIEVKHLDSHPAPPSAANR